MIHNNKGSTIVEVLVAFMIILIMMTMFAGVLNSSLHVFQQANETRKRTETFNQEYYTVQLPESGGKNISLSGNGVSLDLLSGAQQTFQKDGQTRYYFSVDIPEEPETENSGKDFSE